MNRRDAVRWAKRAIHLPIGERWLLISVFAALLGPSWALGVLLVAGLVALAYVTAGRTLRTFTWRGTDARGRRGTALASGRLRPGPRPAGRAHPVGHASSLVGRACRVVRARAAAPRRARRRGDRGARLASDRHRHRLLVDDDRGLPPLRHAVPGDAGQRTAALAGVAGTRVGGPDGRWCSCWPCWGPRPSDRGSRSPHGCWQRCSWSSLPYSGCPCSQRRAHDRAAGGPSGQSDDRADPRGRPAACRAWTSQLRALGRRRLPAPHLART